MKSIEIEKWLEKTAGLEFFDPGLDRIKNFIGLTDSAPSSKIITIAGTNGKGSVARLLAYNLSQNSSVALFTSPHLLKINERFKLGDKNISDTDLEKYLKQVHSTGIKLSYYEYLFAAFLLWLKNAWPDYIVLEVGLGGRLDATNALDADIAVLTSIGRDHQEILGRGYKKILLEKIAVAKKDKFLISGFKLEYLNQLVDIYTQNNGIKWHKVKFNQNYKTHNKSLVQKVFDTLQIKEIVADLPASKDFGESSRKSEFFGSHNPAAVRKLVHFLRQEHYNIDKLGYDLLVLSFSKRDKKDLVTMLKMFDSLRPEVVKKIIVTSFDHFKAEKASVLKEICIENGFEFVDNIEVEIRKADSLIASGSNYFYRDFFNISSKCK